MTLKQDLLDLCSAVAVGTVHEAADLAFERLSQYADCKQNGLTVVGSIKGKEDYTLMLDAHIDEISMIVTHVDDNGFLTVAKCAGWDLRTLPARPVTVHTKSGKYKGVFCSTPPHLAEGEQTFEDISVLKIDSMLGKKAKELIALGDFVTLDIKPVELMGNRITGKSLDDRAGVACLIELARRLKGKELPFHVVFVFSDQEELGTRGARTATYSVNPQEAIAIDVSFGDGPDVPPNDCGLLSQGAMIGFSPVLDREISGRLADLAEEKQIPYQTEVMGRSTGTNSDVISVTRGGVRTGLLSIPLRNMHTDTELLDLSDLESVCDLLESYILTGGVRGDSTVARTLQT